MPAGRLTNFHVVCADVVAPAAGQPQVLLRVAAHALVLHPEAPTLPVHNADLFLEQQLVAAAAGPAAAAAARGVARVVVCCVAAAAVVALRRRVQVVVRQQVLRHGLRDVEALEVGLAGDHARVPVLRRSTVERGGGTGQ